MPKLTIFKQTAQWHGINTHTAVKPSALPISRISASSQTKLCTHYTIASHFSLPEAAGTTIQIRLYEFDCSRYLT